MREGGRKDSRKAVHTPEPTMLLWKKNMLSMGMLSRNQATYASCQWKRESAESKLWHTPGRNPSSPGCWLSQTVTAGGARDPSSGSTHRAMPMRGTSLELPGRGETDTTARWEERGCTVHGSIGDRANDGYGVEGKCDDHLQHQCEKGDPLSSPLEAVIACGRIR